MTQRSVSQGSFTIERTYDASPGGVFRAFADPMAKTAWFRGPEEWGGGEHEMDFRVGGRETNRVGPPGGPVHVFNATFQDIVPGERIISTYEMLFDETRISVSLAIAEFKAAGGGTRLIYTEHGAFLDGFDGVASREEGTRDLLDKLGVALAREAASAPAG
ncbi:MAG: SRPBCC family protein [Caulobacterales bacterium]